MSSNSLDLAALSRKDLQALAKEFQLCRGNAKSDVILQHVQDFVAANPSDGETRVRKVLGSSSDGSGATAPAQVAAEQTPKKATKLEPAAEKKSPAPVAAATKASPKPKAEKTATPRKEDVVAKPESAKKKTPEKKAAVTSSPVIVSAKKAAAAVSPATKQTPPKKSPAKELPAKKSPAKQTPVKKSPAKENSKPVVEKEATPKSKAASRPALASLDSNVVKAKKSGKVTVDSLVASITDLAFAGDGSKVRCSTTGHEMKADVDVINTYISGKSYQRAQLKKQSFASYAPMFTAHPDEKKAHLLWCNVTETEHPREVARIDAHIAGVRYQKELPRWQEEEAARVAAKKEADAKAAAKAKARAAKLKQLEKAENPSAFSSKKRKARPSSSSKTEAVEPTAPVEQQEKEQQKEQEQKAKRPRKRSRAHK